MFFSNFNKLRIYTIISKIDRENNYLQQKIAKLHSIYTWFDRNLLWLKRNLLLIILIKMMTSLAYNIGLKNDSVFEFQKKHSLEKR